MWRSSLLGLLTAIVSPLAIPNLVRAGDWPQILGPHRNGIAVDESLADSWPDSGPRRVWQREVGAGFAGVAVAGGKVILFHRVGDLERVEALNAGSGEKLWQADYAADYVPSVTKDSGPRAVPIIHEGRVYVYGAKGGLRCLDLKTGAKIWGRDTFGDYNSKRASRGEPPEGYFGIGSGPIIEDNKIIVNVGGYTSGAGLVAFALDTGKTVWKSTNERASYSSPVAVTVNGVRHLIFATRLAVVSVNPANGKVRFRFPFGKTGATVTAANPVIIDEHLFVSASYEFGAVFARIGAGNAETLWESDDILSSQYTTCIAHQGHLFGVHGRQDRGLASLRCFEPKTKKINWTEENFGYATLIKADNKLLILSTGFGNTSVDLIMAELNTARFSILAKTQVFPRDSEARPLPALSNGLLFARDENILKCLDLKPQQKP